ncbi:MAG: hypothetical protein CFE25_14600 [Chitinophagaceae bacterium BSSC1]|nr:MAG: hypothetical protein CFE25_14600 [Chitinophagaceae bacterium BSSC1]
MILWTLGKIAEYVTLSKGRAYSFFAVQKKSHCFLSGGALGLFFAVQKNRMVVEEHEGLFFALQKNHMVVGRVRDDED